MEKSVESFGDEREWHTGSYDRTREFDAERRNIVESQLWLGDNPSGEELKIQRGWSLRRTLLNDVTTAAMNHALKAGVPLEEYQDLAGLASGSWIRFKTALRVGGTISQLI